MARVPRARDGAVPASAAAPGPDGDGPRARERLTHPDPGPVGRALVERLRAALSEAADPDRAPAMQAYMKSQLPFWGVSRPVLRRIARTVLADHPLADRADFEATVRTLWWEAGHREERYAALDLMAARPYRRWTDVAALPLYDELVVSGAWWDLVDEVAIHRVGPVLVARPDEVAPVVRAWAGDADPWRRRCAVICQVAAKADTDPGLLADVVLANADDPGFFLRKAIGWALRAFSTQDPEWVRAFVREHEGRLSALSRREALRLIGSRPDH